MTASDLYRRLVDVSPVGIVFVREGKVELVNRTGAEIIGQRREEIVGQRIDSFLAPEVISSLAAGFTWRTVRVGRGETLARTVKLEDGTVILRRVPDEELRAPRLLAVRYETLVERLADTVFLLDLSGRIVFLNQGFTRVTGWERDTWIGRHFTEILAPEYVEETKKRFQAGPPPGGVSQYEIEIIGASGERIPIEIRVTALRDQSGIEIGRIGTARDVRERRRFEETLAQQNKTLDMILNTMGEGVIVLDAQHRMVDMNRKARELFGFSPEEVVGKDYTFWTPPDEVDELRRHLQRREAGEEETYTTRFVRKGGKEFYAQVTAVPIYGENGEFRGSIGCLRDVTRERELSRRVDELSEFNRRLIELADVWIHVVDAKGKIVFWNKEAERISGYTRAEVEESTTVWERLYPDPALLRAAWGKRKPSDGVVPQRTEKAIRTKSGEQRIISWRGRPVHLADGRAGWLIVGHDVTEERRREQRLREYAAKIERLSQVRNRLISMAAHELRTPLTVVRGFIDLVQHAGGLSEQQDHWLRRALEETDRLGRLVTQLLEAAHVEEEGRLHPQVVRLAPLIERSIRELSPILATRGQHIDYTLRPPDIGAWADPQALEVIMRNLLENAVHYTPPSGKITVAAAVDGAEVRVDVTDEGIGIAADELPLVFDEFYRTEAGRRMKRDGTGIGLAIVRRLVEDSGGRIWATSPGLNRGSTFSFTLPAKGDHEDTDH